MSDSSPKLRALTLLLGCLLTPGCHVHTHRVGLGPGGNGSSTARQYYLFFGAVRLNEADSQRLTEGLTSYEIETKCGFTDFLLSPLLLPLTVTSRTVTVTR